jgi:glycerate kinase
LIAHALKNGVKSIVLGCGGSATNDAGIGMACALGFSFLDSNGQALKPIGDNLSKIEIINSAEAMTEIAGCRFIVMSDVNNPLYGLNGAAYTYASQKGASPRDIKLLDDGLKHFSKILKKEQLGTSNFLGAGAAGGFPVSARALLHAEIKSGIDFIIEFAGMAEKVRQADWVITGEGKFDEQSLHGKVISGLARLCLQMNKQLWVVCGVSEVSEKQWRQMGIERVLPISSIAMNMEDAMANADLLIKKELERMLDS